MGYLQTPISTYVFHQIRRRFFRQDRYAPKIVLRGNATSELSATTSKTKTPKKKTIKLTRLYLTRYESTIAEVCFAAPNVLFVWQNIAANQVSILSINNASFDIFPIYWVAIDKA